MSGNIGSGRPTLSQALDKEIYQVVRKIIDEQEQNLGKAPRLTVPFIYEKIKRSNSSLGRRSKKQLEDSIERALGVLKDEESSDDLGSIEGEFDGIEVSEPLSVNGVNRSIVAAWARNEKPAKPLEPVKEGPSQQPKTKKRALEGELPAKKRKGNIEPDRSPPTNVDLRDLGGVDDVIRELTDLIVLPLRQPAFYATAGLQPTIGVLLHGPPGCGKTMIANAFAARLRVPFIAISAPSIVSGMSGESEKALREHFEEARKLAPCVIFIDEIDAITPKRESAQREMEKRIVSQLLTCMDDLALDKTGGKAVVVLAATNRPDSLDPALRRSGRFGKEIAMSVPSETVREQILKAITRKMTLADDIDLRRLAKMTPGYVGADLNDLVSTAGEIAMKRLLEVLKAEDSTMAIDADAESSHKEPDATDELDHLIQNTSEPISQRTLSITNQDFLVALPRIQPSSKREGFATIPDTTWADIGALQLVRKQLIQAIVNPIRSPERYARVGIRTPNGILLWGPPGCGKTLLAKAVANESQANFISIKGPELLNKYVGESERAVRQVFVRARSSVPCVIFFDELDALVPKRNDALSESSARVVNMLLTELDGLSSRQGIYVIGATNRPDMIDPAMLRPGRLEKLLFVDLPGPDERVEILATLVRDLEISGKEGLETVARECEGFSGADLGSLVREAGNEAIDRESESLMLQDFWRAKEVVKPSVRDMAMYRKLRDRGKLGGTSS